MTRANPLPAVDLPAFYTEAPLYERFSYGSHHLIDVWYYNGQSFDCYCDGCGQMSTFRSPDFAEFQLRMSARHAGVPGRFSGAATKQPQPQTYTARFSCSRDPQNHILRIVVLSDDHTLMKIGQYPSLADLAAGNLSKYRRVLSETQFAEFNRGLGLAAHGIGIGSFAYLRRIFENLIQMAHTRAQADTGWNEKAYGRLQHVDERIKALKAHLPAFLVDNARLYGVLSKGLHELSEEECLQAFPAVRVGIELILDQEIARLERLEKEANARKDIAALADKHGPKKRTRTR